MVTRRNRCKECRTSPCPFFKGKRKVMYVEMTKDLEVNLMAMTWEEAVALQQMIEGAGLEQRRMFNGVLRQLKQPFDKLMK